MATPLIEKPRSGWSVEPNLRDYAAARAAFSWDDARRRLDGLPGGAGINIGHEAVDRHARGPRPEKVALRFLYGDGDVREITYRHLAELTDRFAALLRDLGVRTGERVFSLAGRCPELYVAALGTLKAGAVYCPLFSAYGPEPIRTRMEIGDARVLVASGALYGRKVEAMRRTLTDLEHVLLFGDQGPASFPDVRDLRESLEDADPAFEIAPTDPEQMALLHFTSGTTGAPKGAIHVHDAVTAHRATGEAALDLHPEDVFWCTADPGWVTGTSYGIIAPLAVGSTVVVDTEEFEAERWYGILRDQGVNVWYTSPTALRMLRRLEADGPRRRDLPALRLVAAVGEPLDAATVRWGEEALSRPVHDTWWQTETGAIMIANFAAVDIKPGSMGRPVPGIEAAIVDRREDGSVVPVGDDTAGELALRPGWPSMFRGYLSDEERTAECFADGWYLTGDLARRDADGYFWFLGRVGDAIKSSGHLIGPFEVEQVLLGHPAVAGAGVIGVPDDVTGETVVACVTLRAGREPDGDLRRELLARCRRSLGPAVAPRRIEFCSELPTTASGKIVRRVLRARQLGLPEGDVSTLRPTDGPGCSDRNGR